MDAMIERLNEGPPAARVVKVVVEEADPGEVAAGFRILH